MQSNPSNPGQHAKSQQQDLKVVGPTLDPGPHRSSGKHIAAWIGGGILVLLLVLLLAGQFVLNSARFHAYLVHTIDQKATKAVGTRVELENINIQLSTLSANIYGLTVYGAAPYTHPPLLQIQHIVVSIGITSLLHRQWYLKNIVVDAPVIKFFTDAGGVTNLPHSKSSSSGSSTNIFQLGIRHAALHDGAIFVNDRKIPLEADVQQLAFHSRTLVGQQGYTGAISYQNGLFQTGAYQPIAHSLDASFTVTPDTFKLNNGTLHSGSSLLHLVANVSNFSAPIADAKYDLSLNGGDLRAILKNASIPSGLVVTSGTIHYDATLNKSPAGNASALDAIAVHGSLHSQLLVVRTPQIHTDIRNLAGAYSLQNSNLVVKNFQANLLHGKVLAALQVNHLTGTMQSLLTAAWSGISLRDVQDMLVASAAKQEIAKQGIELTGAANGNIKVVGGKALKTLVAQLQSSIHGKITNKNSGSSLPLDSEIQLAYLGPSQQIQVQNSYVKMPQTALILDGTLRQNSNIHIQFLSADLRELQTLVDVFHPGTLNSSPSLGLAGQASFVGTLRGTAKAPQLSGQLAATNVHMHGTVWPHIQSGIAVDSHSASLQNTSLQMLPSGSIHLHAKVGLKNNSFDPGAPVELQLQALRLPVEPLAKLVNIQSPVSGELSVNADVHGTAENPIGHGSLALNHGIIYDEPLQSANLVFNGTEDNVHGDLSLKVKAGTLHSTATVQPKEKTFTAQLDAEGILLEQFKSLLSRGIGGKGEANLHASGQGTFQNPSATVHLEIPTLNIQGQKISDVLMDANLADHIGTATASLRAEEIPIQAHAKIKLTGNQEISATLDTQTLSLQTLAALYAPQVDSRFTGQTEVHATLQGPLKQKQLLVAHVTLPILRMSYGAHLQLAATAPIHADYSQGVLQLHPVTLQGTGTHLELRATMPIYGSQPMDGLLAGTVDLQLAQMLSSDITSSGKLVLDIHANGNRSNPDVGGQIMLQDASYTDSTQPVGLQHGNGIFALTKDRLNIRSFQGKVGSGTLTAQGAVIYRPALQFDLGATAKNVRLLYPEGLREDLSADLRFVGSIKDSQLGGTVQVNDVSFTPAFDLMGFIGNLSGGIAAPPTPGFSQNLHLQLAVNSTSGIDMVSRQLSLNGNANLQVQGTAAQPVILGRVNVNSGDLIFNGNRYVLKGGTVQFVNASETEPVVNVTLDTTIQQYNIHLRFNGPIDQIQTNYASDPSLPYADIIHLLAFGDTTEANAANGSTPGNAAAESVLASQVSSQVTSRVSKIAGISQLSINPVLAGGTSQGPAGAIVTVQQRVTGNFFVTFSTNVTTTQDQIVMGQYQLSPRVAVTGTRDQNGGFAVDTIIKKTW